MASTAARIWRCKPSPPRSCSSISPSPTTGRTRRRCAHRCGRTLGKTIDEIWGANESDSSFVAKNFSAAVESLRNRDKALAELHPSTDAEKQALAAATSIVDAIGQARLQMSFALSNPVSYPLILMVVGWAMFLFCGYGLMSKGNPMSIAVGAVGAIAIASAVYLILDLSDPYSGPFRASSAPLEQVLAIMGKE